jgi:hypothetical protein
MPRNNNGEHSPALNIDLNIRDKSQPAAITDIHNLFQSQISNP